MRKYRFLSLILAVVLTISLLNPLSVSVHAADKVYYPIDFTEDVLASRVIQQVSGGCAVASMATIEAYMYGATTEAEKKIVYDTLIEANGDDSYAYWGNVGFITSQDSIDWDAVYSQISQGTPCIIHRPANGSQPQHWSVVAGYQGSSTNLEPDKFLVVEVNEKSGAAIQTVAQWRGSVAIDRYTWRGSGITLTKLPGIRFAINHPPVIKEYGTAHRVYGRISSDSSLVQIEVSVTNLDTGEFKFYKNLTPNVGSYDISALDSSMSYSSWEKGAYYYTVYARNAAGAEDIYGVYFEIASSYPQKAPNPAYTFSFDANGGSGTMNSLSVHMDEALTLPACTMTRKDSTFGGWYVQRNDETWLTTAKLWLTEEEIAAEGYSKYLFQDRFSGVMDAWWIWGALIRPAYTFVAQWPDATTDTPDVPDPTDPTEPEPSEPPEPDSDIPRLYGSNRSATAIEVAETMKDTLGVETFDSIIIASGDNFADALAGSCLAAQEQAPILLHRASAVTMNTEYIQKNLRAGGTVYLLGGTSAVPEAVETTLEDAGINVQRLAGTTRFDTNLEILEEVKITSGQEILISTGHNFADSLSASATGLPILMVNNTTGKLTDAQVKFLESLQNCSFTIIGGTSAVSQSLENAISAFGDVTRLSGSNREATSILVAETYFTNPELVVLAYSRNFPDGLCGGPLANLLGVPLILTNAGHETATAKYIADNGITTGIVLGGTAALSNKTVNAIFSSN